MLEIEPGPSAKDVLAAVLSRSKDTRNGDIRFVGSGKAAIRLIFEYLRSRGVLENKMTPVLVPPWLGTWVYAELLPFAFPTTFDVAGVKSMLCYHQYGFPQDMDRVLDIAKSRGIVVIEDCAHACSSEYKGCALGGFGEFSLFSYSKFTFCFALGGVSSRNQDFYTFVDQLCAHGSVTLRALVNGIKLVDEANLHLSRPIAKTVMNGLRKMAYARYGDQVLPGARAVKLWEQKKAHEIEVRRENYGLLRRGVDHWGICDHLERDGVVPYLVPLAIDVRKARHVIAKLRENTIAADWRNFDFARCSFEPNYRKCVVVPIHSGMASEGMERLVSTLKGVL